jgi:E3 ubiquitin-protein ligase HERC3
MSPAAIRLRSTFVFSTALCFVGGASACDSSPAVVLDGGNQTDASPSDGADGGVTSDGGGIGPDGAAQIDASSATDSGADGGALSAVVRQISVGTDNTSCAVMADGRVKCWGSNWAGQLGLGDKVNRGEAPLQMGSALPYVDLGSGRTAKAVAVGGSHACAILNNDQVKCWGRNFFIHGQLGLGDDVDRGGRPGEMGDVLPTVNLGTGRTAKQLSAAADHTCAILDNDKVKCWGDNTAGSLGLGDQRERGVRPSDMGDSLPYVDLGTGRTAKAVAVSRQHVCALLDNNGVKCWGAAVDGRLGLGDDKSRGEISGQMGDALPLVNLGTGRTAKAVVVRGVASCAILDNNAVKCWGFNGNGGILGLGDIKSRGASPADMGDALPFVNLGSGRTAISLSGGGAFFCAALDNGKIKCWGQGDQGCRGTGDTDSAGYLPETMGDGLPFVDLGANVTVKSISAGNRSACAILGDDSMKCWGSNVSGNLGLGDQNDRGDQPGEMGGALAPVKLVGP